MSTRAPAAPAAKSKTPIILACSGGGVLLLIILFVALSGEDPKPKPSSSKPKASVEDAPRKIAPDVSGLESTGKQKCDEGLRIVESRANPDPSIPKEQFRADLEKGLVFLKEGLEAYDKATKIAGKKYDTGKFSRARNVALTLFCGDLEKEAKSTCDEGLALIRSTAGLMTGKALSDDEKQKLTNDLQKARSLISSGMGLLSRVENVAGRTSVDTGDYLEAQKVARLKLGELR
jgi:hypothetical protein